MVSGRLKNESGAALDREPDQREWCWYARLIMRIARELYDEIVAHARAETPNECCGMIATRDGAAVHVYRTTNAAASPLRFEIEPDEQIRVHTEIELADLDLGAIYHSHTRTSPRPSQTDINFAAW